MVSPRFFANIPSPDFLTLSSLDPVKPRWDAARKEESRNSKPNTSTAVHEDRRRKDSAHVGKRELQRSPPFREKSRVAAAVGNRRNDQTSNSSVCEARKLGFFEMKRADPETMRIVNAIKKAGNDSSYVDYLLGTLTTRKLKLEPWIFSVALSSASRGPIAASSSRVEELLAIADREKVKVDTSMLNAALAALGRSGDEEKTTAKFREIVDCKMADKVTYTTMISFYCDRVPPDLDSAEKMFLDLLSHGFVPEIRTFTSLIGACSKALPFADLERAERYFEDMVAVFLTKNKVQSFFFFCKGREIWHRSYHADLQCASLGLRQNRDPEHQTVCENIGFGLFVVPHSLVTLNECFISSFPFI